jgi:hypothetical protein
LEVVGFVVHGAFIIKLSVAGCRSPQKRFQGGYFSEAEEIPEKKPNIYRLMAVQDSWV